MSGDLGQEPEGATPLTDDDLQGLIPAWVTTKADLNRAEATTSSALEPGSNAPGVIPTGSGLTWGGGGDLASASELHTDYIAALRIADRGEFEPLIEFATRP